MSQCLVEAFEFHALGCQAFRRGSGICQRPLTEDRSQLDKIYGPNFFFYSLSLFFGFLLGSKISNVSILTMEVPTLKIQDYPYFSINKRKAGFHKNSSHSHVCCSKVLPLPWKAAEPWRKIKGDFIHPARMFRASPVGRHLAGAGDGEMKHPEPVFKSLINLVEETDKYVNR